MITTIRSSVLLLIASQLLHLVAVNASPTSIARVAKAAETGKVAVARGIGRSTGNVRSQVSSRERRASTGYTDPRSNGGSMLTIVNGTYPAGLGEPLNVIISGESDAAVLAASSDNGGFLNYMLATDLGEECLGQHLGSDQDANLGDGKGNVTQVQELRWDYGDPYIGTCKETFSGGLHLRYWVQNTTGAYFLAVSVEESLTDGHDIIANGYDVGRDYLVGNLTGTTVPTRNVTNSTTYSGSSTYANYTYQTDVKYVSGLLNDSSNGINHYLTVQEDGYPAIDGLVAVLTVKITAKPKSSFAVSALSGVPVLALLSSVVLSALFTLI